MSVQVTRLMEVAPAGNKGYLYKCHCGSSCLIGKLGISDIRAVYASATTVRGVAK